MPNIKVGTQADFATFPKTCCAGAGTSKTEFSRAANRDWKPMSTVGPGVRELRIQQRASSGELCFANLPEAIFVLSAVVKKARKTPQSELDLAAD